MSIFIRFCLVGLLLTIGAGCSSTSKKKSLSDKERSVLLLQIAKAALLEGDPTGALINLQDAEDLNPKDADIHHTKALAYFAKRDPATALVAARRAVELKPEFPEANTTLGKFLLDAGKIEESEKYLVRAAHNPLYREAYKARINLGMLYEKKGKRALAKKEFSEAIIEAPQDSCLAYYYRGKIHFAEKDYKRAVKDLQKSVENFCGHFAEAHFFLGLAYAQTRDYDRARRKFVEVKQLFPESDVASRATGQLRSLP